MTDINRARRFYEQLLGLNPVLEYEGAPGKWWIEYDVGGVTLAIKNFDGSAGKVVPALEVADINAAFRTIQASNETITQELEEFPSCRSFTCTDPDGNEIIFHQLKSADEVPTFDPEVAQEVRPYLHQTGRTVGHRQPAPDGKTHLFSPSGLYVATE